MNWTPSGAIFSPCRKYRPLLWRTWGDGPALVGLCCNPSDADETRNDPTVTRMIERAHRLGFAGFKMLNMFDWVSTDPGVLVGVRFPVSIDNDATILRECLAAGMVICGWGNASKLIPWRAVAVRKFLREAGVKLHYLTMGATGQPWHPLYIGYDVQPTEWNI